MRARSPGFLIGGWKRMRRAMRAEAWTWRQRVEIAVADKAPLFYNSLASLRRNEAGY